MTITLNLRDLFHSLHWHRWSNVGLYDGDDIIRPCLVGDCPSALVTRPDKSRRIRRNVFFLQANGDPLTFDDDPRGGIAKIVAREMEQDYRLGDIDFKPGDVVFDIGAHVGVVSIWLAKKFPTIRIFAFEPVAGNFARLVSNIQANSVYNVTPVNVAIGSGASIKIRDNLTANSGGGSAYFAAGGGSAYEAITLPKALNMFGVDRLKLLKIDCEGGEYAALVDDAALRRVDNMAGEFHDNPTLAQAGHDGQALKDRVSRLVSGAVNINIISMGE